MEISTLIADPVALRLDCIRPFQSEITLVVRTTLANAGCPAVIGHPPASTVATPVALQTCRGMEYQSNLSFTGIEIVSRDGSRTYANGSTEGAPAAVQGAGRWHLLKNLREALENLLKRQLQQKRQRAHPCFCPSIVDEAEAGGYLERCRARACYHT